LFIGSRFTLHASFPHSVALMQLRFTSLAVTSSWRDLHPQECAHAGRTRQKPHSGLGGLGGGVVNAHRMGMGHYAQALKHIQCAVGLVVFERG
jgi:hypothetical protein